VLKNFIVKNTIVENVGINNIRVKNVVCFLFSFFLPRAFQNLGRKKFDKKFEKSVSSYFVSFFP